MMYISVIGGETWNQPWPSFEICLQGDLDDGVREEKPWCVAPSKFVEVVKGLSLLWVAKGARTKDLSSVVEAAEPSWVSLATKDLAVVDVLALWILVGWTPFPAPCVSSVRRISCLHLRPAPEVAVCASDFYPFRYPNGLQQASPSFSSSAQPMPRDYQNQRHSSGLEEDLTLRMMNLQVDPYPLIGSDQLSFAVVLTWMP